MASKPQGLPANFYSTAETRSATYLDSNQKVGDKVTLTVIRQGNEQTVEATLAEWPSAQ